VVISDCSSLQQISSALNGDFYVTTNIDCRGDEFVPIGNASAPFTGTFDGMGHTISGLSIMQMQSDYVALFGFVVQAKIHNVAISARVNGNSYVGVLAGLCNSSQISNVTVSGTVMGGMYGGGLAGAFLFGKLVNCTSSVTTISNGGQAGGLVGAAASVIIMRCSSSGTTSATCQNPSSFYVGGLVGSINGSKDELSFITESSATGAVGSTCNWAGGIAGSADTFTSIQNCYSTSDVLASSSSYQSPGGLVGNPIGSFVVFSYYAGKSSCQSSNCNAGGLFSCWQSSASVLYSYYDANRTSDDCSRPGNTTQQMMLQATYQNWDFDQTWGIHENVSYPYLLLQ